MVLAHIPPVETAHLFADDLEDLHQDFIGEGFDVRFRLRCPLSFHVPSLLRPDILQEAFVSIMCLFDERVSGLKMLVRKGRLGSGLSWTRHIDFELRWRSASDALQMRP